MKWGEGKKKRGKKGIENEEGAEEESWGEREKTRRDGEGRRTGLCKLLVMQI